MMIIVHVGTESVKTTCALASRNSTSGSSVIFYNHTFLFQAKHAQDCGASAIGVMPTTFFKPETIGMDIIMCRYVCMVALNLCLGHLFQVVAVIMITFSLCSQIT